MKETIRQGVFETNSSSTHTLAIYSADEYDNNLYYYQGDILTREELEKDYDQTEFSSFEEFLAKKLVAKDDIEKILNNYEDEYFEFCEEYVILYKDYIDYDDLHEEYEYLVESIKATNGETFYAISEAGYNY